MFRRVGLNQINRINLKSLKLIQPRARSHRKNWWPARSHLVTGQVPAHPLKSHQAISDLVSLKHVMFKSKETFVALKRCECMCCRVQACLLGLHSKLASKMVSETDRTKRALVSLLKTLAGIYAVTLNITRDSADKEEAAAFRRLSNRSFLHRRGVSLIACCSLERTSCC